MNLILTDTILELMVKKWKKQKLKIVLTNGCFDLLHAGHLHTFQEAKKMGDILLVGINSDFSIRRLKGEPRPIIPEKERALMVAALKPVDYCIIFNELTADHLLEKVIPEFYVKGGDYTLKSLPEKETLIKYNIKTIFIPLVSGISTTEIISKIFQCYHPTTLQPKPQFLPPGR